MKTAQRWGIDKFQKRGRALSAGAKLLAHNWDVGKALRTNDLLRKDEWIRLDEAVVRVARTLITAIADLRAAGLVRNLGSLGVLIDQYERVTEVEPAEQNMTGVAPGERDLPEYTLVGVPIPITFKDFQVNIRTLEASRTMGAAMDTVTAELCTRQVAESLDDMVFNGSNVQVDGTLVRGYTTHPDRITGSLTGNGWDDAATRDIIADSIAMVAAAEAQNYRGPFTMYVPVAYMSELRADYSTAKGDRTFLERILAIDAINAVKSSPDLTGDEVLLVQLTSDTVDLSVGQDIVTVEWDEMGGLVSNFKIMAAMAPRVKSTAVSATGVVHFT